MAHWKLSNEEHPSWFVDARAVATLVHKGL